MKLEGSEQSAIRAQPGAGRTLGYVWISGVERASTNTVLTLDEARALRADLDAAIAEIEGRRS